MISPASPATFGRTPIAAAAAVALEPRWLALFDELHRTRSLSRAAERLGVAQPTASIWLAMLRKRLADPLFVRTSTGMQPTPRADALVGTVREALALLRRVAAGDAPFVPAASQRSFRIAMTDASHVTLLPRLLARVRALAPAVRLEVTPISTAASRMLESGEVDLALGYIPDIAPGFHEQPLYEQTFVCLVGARHPRIGQRLTLAAYRREEHVGILSAASYPMLQRELARRRVHRRVVLELPGFLGVAAIVSSTDLIATVPSMIGEALAAGGLVRALPVPVPMPAFLVKAYWHARLQHDAAHRWLRSQCAELFARRNMPMTRDARRAAPR
jgi:DNA-binding transcriptional LysR family regulator